MSEIGGLRGLRAFSGWFTPLALFVVILACFIPTASDDYANVDAYSSSVAAWRIATTGQPWMEGVDFNSLSGSFDAHAWQYEIHGHVVTTRMYGPILVAVPFYLLRPYEDEASFTIYPGGIAAAVMVAAATVFLFLGCRRYVGDTKALAGAAAFGLTTPAWSVAANALWTHPMTMFGLAGAAWSASRDRWWVAGLFLGVGMWGRPHIALVAAIVGVGLGWSRRSVRIPVGLAVPTVLSLVLLAFWSHYVFGIWNPLGAYSSHHLKPVVEDFGGGLNQFQNVAGFLISPDRGFLVWSPIVLLLLPAVVRSWRLVPDWTRWLAVGGVAYTAVQLGLNYFGGSSGFYGYRHGLELLVCITPVCTLSVDALGRRARNAAPVVIAMQFAMIAPGAVFEAFYLGPNDVWHDNSYWFALRNYPLIFGPFTVICLLAGAYLSLRLDGREPSLRPTQAKTRRCESDLAVAVVRD